jgi:hypothetical protein
VLGSEQEETVEHFKDLMVEGVLIIEIEEHN